MERRWRNGGDGDGLNLTKNEQSATMTHDARAIASSVREQVGHFERGGLPRVLRTQPGRAAPKEWPMECAGPLTVKEDEDQ